MKCRGIFRHSGSLVVSSTPPSHSARTSAPHAEQAVVTSGADSGRCNVPAWPQTVQRYTYITNGVLVVGMVDFPRPDAANHAAKPQAHAKDVVTGEIYGPALGNFKCPALAQGAPSGPLQAALPPTSYAEPCHLFFERDSLSLFHTAPMYL